MQKPDGLYFAPNVRFRDLYDADANELADALESRSMNWFLMPAKQIAQTAPFSSGIIVTCFIDAASEIEGINVIDWLKEAVPSSSELDPRRTKKSIADSFYEDVRHGLIHHSRLSRGAEFSLDLNSAIEVVNSVLVVNPSILIVDVIKRWEETLSMIRVDEKKHQKFLEEIRKVFRVDFEADETWDRM